MAREKFVYCPRILYFCKTHIPHPDMKNFIKHVLATVVGILLAGGVVLTLGLLAVAGIVMSGDSAPAVKPGSILHIDLDGELAERFTEDPLSSLLGDDYSVIGLEQALTAIEKARTHADIKGIYLSAGTLAGATPGMLEELRQALLDFKKSGKFIVAYGDGYSQGGYYVCSVADKIILNPHGTLEWKGLATEVMFVKDLLAKAGVRMQVFKVGSYKSAVEPFVATEMSEANREQINSYLTDIWQRMLTEVSASRKIKPETLDAYADSMLLFASADELVQMQMVDTLCYWDGVQDYLKKLTATKDGGKLSLLTVNGVEKLPAEGPEGEDEVAVYYAYGDIVDRASGVGGSPCISGETMCRDLKQLRTDKKVKAVVIRVNSGGGSAHASEQIWREVQLLQQEKPVVVSMGGMAASGGYYLSCGAGHIVAEPTTLTGSIGIFGMFPDASELLTDKLELRSDIVKTNRMADFGSIMRPFNDAEKQKLQTYIESGYQLFIKRVTEGRKIDVEQRRLAGGRVWTGQQALKNGLVDQLGNLQDAIAQAAKVGKLEKNYTVKHYPRPAAWYENVLNKERNNYLDTRMREALGAYYTGFSLVRNLEGQPCIQARMPYFLNFTN